MDMLHGAWIVPLEKKHTPLKNNSGLQTLMWVIFLLTFHAWKALTIAI